MNLKFLFENQPRLFILLFFGLILYINCDEQKQETSEELLVVEIKDSVDPIELASRHGHKFEGQVGSLKGFYTFKKLPQTILGVTHPHYNSSPEIFWFERQIARQLYKRDFFNDPLYSSQWHLHSSNFVHVDINVEKVWKNLNITGSSSLVSIVDDGLEYTHLDIAPNYVASASYDFNNNDPSPFPDSSNDDHGTSAGGVAAARDNDICGVGSAPRSGLSGIRLISRATTDSQEATALNYAFNQNDIYSNSWGPMDDGKRKEGPGRLATLALQNGVNQGRNGKGSIFVWAGGNGRRSNDNCNYDGWANSRFTIAVGAVDHLGVQAWYSEPCSMLVISAPSSGSTYSITTTDLKGNRGYSTTDCTSNFGGTSAAAPLVSGVIALILHANPNLGWRDVQAVIILSATKNDPNNEDWKQNGAGLWVNHRYGFGMINAYDAVVLSTMWENLAPSLFLKYVVSDSQTISDFQLIEIPINVDGDIIVEHITVLFQASHRRRGDLRIILVSPSGTESILAEPHPDITADYNWTFATIRCWGENSLGKWILKVKDEVSGIGGQMISVTFTVYGH